MIDIATVAVAWLCVSGAALAKPSGDPAATLRARYAAMPPRPEQSLFPQGLYVESVEGARSSQGDVYAVVAFPIAKVSAAFSNPAQWCEALILHLNVKYCRPVVRDKRTDLSVAIGTKRDQPLGRASRVEFAFTIASSRPDYLDVELYAAKGPLGTGNYRIALQAAGMQQDRTLVHLRYSYTYGPAARMAMQTYLSTSGSDKVGFTTSTDPNDSRPEFIGGVRGAIERNTMRYYLALDAYLGSLATPAPARFEDSLERWFSATERYPRQLREVDRDSYLAMKRNEYQRQQTLQ